MVHAGRPDHLRLRAAVAHHRDALLLDLRHQAPVRRNLLRRHLPVGKIGIADVRDVVLNLDHCLDVFERHRRPVDPHIRLGVIVAREHSAQFVQRDVLAIHLDRPVLRDVAVLVQQTVLFQQRVVLLRFRLAANHALERLQHLAVVRRVVVRQRRQRPHRQNRQQHNRRHQHRDDPFPLSFHV